MVQIRIISNMGTYINNINHLLIFLSTSYLIAQLLEAKLDLITECPEPIKTRENMETFL